MAKFTIRVQSDLRADKALTQLLNWDAHSKAIPFTKLHHEGQPRVGQVFNARTAVGPLGFDDLMEITHLTPPSGNSAGEVTIAKKGATIRGAVQVRITPNTQGSEVEWAQELKISWIPGFFDPVVAMAGRLAYGQGISRILKSAARDTPA